MLFHQIITTTETERLIPHTRAERRRKEIMTRMVWVLPWALMRGLQSTARREWMRLKCSMKEREGLNKVGSFLSEWEIHHSETKERSMWIEYAASKSSKWIVFYDIHLPSHWKQCDNPMMIFPLPSTNFRVNQSITVVEGWKCRFLSSPFLSNKTLVEAVLTSLAIQTIVESNGRSGRRLWVVTR